MKQLKNLWDIIRTANKDRVDMVMMGLILVLGAIDLLLTPLRISLFFGFYGIWAVWRAAKFKILLNKYVTRKDFREKLNLPAYRDESNND